MPDKAPSGAPGVNLGEETSGSGGTDSAPAASAGDLIGSASTVASLKAQLSAEFSSSSDKSFILMHGVKTFPASERESLRDPMLTEIYSKAIFGEPNAQGVAKPQTETTLAQDAPTAQPGTHKRPNRLRQAFFPYQ